jgi:hypothetical protein
MAMNTVNESYSRRKSVHNFFVLHALIVAVGMSSGSGAFAQGTLREHAPMYVGQGSQHLIRQDSRPAGNGDGGLVSALRAWRYRYQPEADPSSDTHVKTLAGPLGKKCLDFDELQATFAALVEKLKARSRAP